ncbi:MAG: hypothetical protein Q7S20_11005 [Gemmatimonadaceae bacterium]|nr:hypothetical protein [Gemmatimonadaceae bacterium]
MPDARASIRVRDWLASRSPAPPPALARRLAQVVGDRTEKDMAGVSSSLVEAAEHLMTHLGDDRAAAPDLLAADALITYAMEVAADDCGDVEAIATLCVSALSASRCK